MIQESPHLHPSHHFSQSKKLNHNNSTPTTEIDEASHSIRSHTPTNKTNSSSSRTQKDTASILKSIESSTPLGQNDLFSATNDPVFYPGAGSPNVLLDFSKGSSSVNNINSKYHHSHYNNSTFKAAATVSSILASTKKPYNNFFLTPLKEGDRRKPAYINSMFKESPSFNGNNICRRLNFDDDFEEISGSSLMPANSIFEEKRGVYSHFGAGYNLHQFTGSSQFYLQQLHQQSQPHPGMSTPTPGVTTPAHSHGPASLSYVHPMHLPHYDIYSNTKVNILDFQKPSDLLSQHQQQHQQQSQQQQQQQHSPSADKTNNDTSKSVSDIICEIDIDLQEEQDADDDDGDDEDDIELGDTSSNCGQDASSKQDAITLLRPAAESTTHDIFPPKISIPAHVASMAAYNSSQPTTSVFIPANPQSSASDANAAGSSSGPQTAAGQSSKKQKNCNCKKTKCLKLYCDCFAAGELCGMECNCYGCHNNSTSDKRTDAIFSIIDRQPDAFGPKVQSNTHKKGCHCTRSGCLKKYCECYNLGVNCGEYCKCQQCKNVNINHTERLALLQQQQQQLSQQAAQPVEIANDRQQVYEDIEEQSSTKKKLFTSAQNAIKAVSQSTAMSSMSSDENLANEEQNNHMKSESMKKKAKGSGDGGEDQDDDHDADESDHLGLEIDDDDDDDDEYKIDNDNQLALSPQTQMYTTPNKHVSSSLRSRDVQRTADTAAKKQQTQQQSASASEIESEIKNNIVKLKISETASNGKRPKRAAALKSRLKSNTTMNPNSLFPIL